MVVFPPEFVLSSFIQGIDQELAGSRRLFYLLSLDAHDSLFYQHRQVVQHSEDLACGEEASRGEEPCYFVCEVGLF